MFDRGRKKEFYTRFIIDDRRRLESYSFFDILKDNEPFMGEVDLRRGGGRVAGKRATGTFSNTAPVQLPVPNRKNHPNGWLFLYGGDGGSCLHFSQGSVTRESEHCTVRKIGVFTSLRTGSCTARRAVRTWFNSPSIKQRQPTLTGELPLFWWRWGELNPRPKAF